MADILFQQGSPVLRSVLRWLRDPDSVAALCCTCKAAASAVPPAVIREHFDARDAIAWGADDGSRRTSPTVRKWGFTNDLFLFTARQRDDLESDIMAKAAPLNMCNYNFVVMPQALCDLSRTNGIRYFNSYTIQ